MARILRVLALVFFLSSMVAPVFAQSQVPTLTGVVTDYTQTLSTGEIQEIEQQGQQIVSASAGRLNRIYVLLSPNLYGYSDSNEFGRAVFDANGLGMGDVLITIEFDSRALVLTNSSELDQDFLKSAPTCQGDWGTYIVTDVMPGYLVGGDFTGGVKAAMQEIGRIVTQAPTDCSIAAAPVQVQPIQSQPVSTGSDFGTWLIICVLVVIVILIIVMLIAISDSGGYVSTSVDGYSSRGPSYTWPSSPTYQSSGPSRSSSRSGGFSSGQSSSRGSFGSGGSSSRSSFSSGGSSSRSSSSSSSSRSGKW